MFYRPILVAAVAASVAAAPAAAQSSEKDKLTAELRLAVDRGEMLYLYDRVAWLGTDDFTGHYANLMDQTGGYIVTGDENQTELAFFNKAKSNAIYRATFTLGKLARSGPPSTERVELTPLEKRMIAAKEKGMAVFVQAKVGLCADANPNVAAIPPETPDGPVIVYLMTPQTDLKTYPLGGHYSVEVAKDGSTGKVRHFANSCIAMPLDQLPKGAKPAAFVVTHLLDPTPTEIHIFTSLASKMPIIVATRNKWIWGIEGSSVRTVDRLK